MEYQKTANLIDDYASNQPSKFRTRNWIEINDESRGAYNVNSQIKFKTTMLKSSLCDYSDVYILAKGTISVNNSAAQGAAANNANKKVIFKNCAPFTNCISEINNTQIDNATVNPNQNATFTITDTKLYVPVVTLSTQENTKFLQQLKSGFKRVINWNKYLSKPELLAQNPNFNHLVEPSFQGINRLFVLAFENDDDRTSDEEYYLPTVELKDYNIVINGENFFDQPIKNNKVTYDNIRKIATGQGDDYTTDCLLDYPYFKDTYKMIAVDLSKQQALDADPRAIQQINLTANLDRAGNTTVYFILEEAKETILGFSQETVKVL